jgi:hypothetical protein
VTIKEGFGFILTGNINEGGADRYIMRQDLDAAFLSRLHLMKHDYLPQVKVGTLDEAAVGDGKGGRNELFELMVSRAMDKNGNVEIPAGEMRKLWNLAKAARATEDNFSGGSVDNSQFFKQGGGTTVFDYRLKEGVLSIRGIDRIITAWQNDGYRNELDRYVFNEFVNQPTKLSDKAYLYQLFKDQYGFFAGAGWEQNPDYGSKGIVSAFKVQAPANAAPKIEFLGPRQVVDTVFGKGPDRTKWPEYRKSGIAPEMTTESREVALARRLSEFEDYNQQAQTRMDLIAGKIRNIPDSEGEFKDKMSHESLSAEVLRQEFSEAIEKAAQSGDFSQAGAMKDDIEERLAALEASLSKNESISLKEAKEIMGANFFGPEEVQSALGLQFNEKIPEINFSKEILEKFKDTHQLILYGGKFLGLLGTPPTTSQIFSTKFGNKKKDGTKLLHSIDWYKDEKFFTQERTKLEWKLVSKDLIPNSTSKNYLEQTSLLADYVRNMYDNDSQASSEVKDALLEWNRLKHDSQKFDELQKNTVSQTEAEWKSAADTLESLKLTQLFRESFGEWLYRTALTERATGERLLPNTYSWTKSRTSGGEFVIAGGFGDDGGHVDRCRPRDSRSDIGCAFSAVKL